MSSGIAGSSWMEYLGFLRQLVGYILVDRKRDALISRQPRWSNCRDRSWTKRKKLKSLPEIDLDMTRLSLMSGDRAFSGSETPSLLCTY